jgi:hypothetical protein
MLVSWLCWIGTVPGVGEFTLFGTAAGFTFLLAVFSFENLHKVLGAKSWHLLRIIGMNFILYAFLTDFMQNPLHGGVKHVVAYLPFVVMGVAAPLLRVAAWGIGPRIRPHSTNCLVGDAKADLGRSALPSEVPPK